MLANSLETYAPPRQLGRYELIAPLGEEREGYVPNVVYTCGAMVHGDHLLIPYAQADKSTGISAVELSGLINRLLDGKT